ncbi:MAG: hypothetical protein WAW10_14400, partial [Gallionella sp.]
MLRGLTHIPPLRKAGEFRPFPFKGKAKMGMGSLAAFTPTPTLPLKGSGIKGVVFALNFRPQHPRHAASLGKLFPYPAWISAAIKNGEYCDCIISDTIINSKWKTFGEQPMIA